MADDWQVGDLALCVHGSDWVPGGASERVPDEVPPIVSALFPAVGTKWVVNHIKVHNGSQWIEQGCSDGDVVYLGLDGQPAPYLYDSRHFHKIRAHEADAEDTETIRLLNSQPVREGA